MEQLKQYSDTQVFKTNELVQAYYHIETFGDTPMHTHNFYELNIIISGNGKHIVNNTAFHVTSGDVFIMPPNISHGYNLNSKKYTIFHLLFSKDFFKKHETHLNKLAGYQILFKIDPLIRNENTITNGFLHIDITDNYNLTRVFDELAMLGCEHTANSEQEKEYLALYVIAKICDMIEKGKATHKGSKRYKYDMLKSVEYIHANYSSKIDLQKLYMISCMSRSTYIRYFKQLFNCTPNDYIRNYRLRQSKAMLKHTNKSLTTIAIDCGFCDSAHYSRLFKEKYEMSPSEYKYFLKVKDTSKQNVTNF